MNDLAIVGARLGSLATDPTSGAAADDRPRDHRRLDPHARPGAPPRERGRRARRDRHRSRFARAGFQCATHAIGDRAVAAALDAYRDAGRSGTAPHRIEHIETLRDAELARFASEGVAASMQPLHAAHLDEPGPYK
jgi:Amidohydrolase family